VIVATLDADPIMLISLLKAHPQALVFGELFHMPEVIG
jgi:hypothetical protein